MSYIETFAEIGRIDNGYVITARMPLKPESAEKACGCVCPVDRKEKTVFCKSPEEVGKKLEALMAWVIDDPQTEYEEAFESASEE